MTFEAKVEHETVSCIPPSLWLLGQANQSEAWNEQLYHPNESGMEQVVSDVALELVSMDLFQATAPTGAALNGCAL